MGDPVAPTVLVLGPGGPTRMTPSEALGLDVAALTKRVAAVENRVGVLEGRPEEAAHFTASAKLPAVAALSSMTLTLTGLVPARAGDVLKVGETVTVEPASALPAELNLSAAYVPADGTVAVQISASVAVSAGAAAIVWNITALR